MAEAPVALVTGAGAPRLGNAIARALAARGYRLILHAHRSLEGAQKTAAECVALGGTAVAMSADLSDEVQVERLLDAAVHEAGRIDVLVNTAAIWAAKPLEQVTAADVIRNFRTNVLSTFLLAQRGGLRMVEQPGGGAIVNFGDWATVRPYRDYSAYFATKGAIEALTRSLAVELAARNPRIRVNALLPGPVMLRADMPDEERQASIAGTLARREGSADDVVRAVLFLLESEFVTGVCLPVDGGRTIAGG